MWLSQREYVLRKSTCYSGLHLVGGGVGLGKREGGEFLVRPFYGGGVFLRIRLSREEIIANKSVCKSNSQVRGML